MIDCRQCGHRNEEGATFCAKCRRFLEWASDPVPAGPPSAISVVLKKRELQAEPGSECICEVEILNRGTIVDECRLTITGETTGWSRVEPAVLRLLPNTRGAALLAFRPPRSPEVRSGPASFVLTAASTVHPEVADSAAGVVTVAAFTELSASLMPQISESTGAAEHTIEVDNQGNAPVRVGLRVVDPNDVLSIDLNETNLMVQPGQRATSHIRVAARKRGERRDGARKAFQVMLLPTQGGRILLDGAFVPLTPPPSWLMRHRLQVAAIAAVGMVALGAVWASASSRLPWGGPATGRGAVPAPTPSAQLVTVPTVAPPPAPTPTPTPPPPPTTLPTSNPPTVGPTRPPTTPPPRAARVEAETQATESNVPSLVGPQADCCGVHWSNSRQLFFRANAPGQYVTIDFDVGQTWVYRVDLRMSRAPDYGMYSIELDGQALATGYQGYVPGVAGSTVVVDTVPLSSGLRLDAGRHRLTVRVTGKSGSSSGYLAGVDYIDLTPT